MFPSLKSITTAVQRFLLGTRAFTTGALAIGTTKSKIKTAAAINYCIDGIMYVKAATDDLFVFTDVTVQAISTTKYYLLCLDASGTATVISGTSTGLPAIPDGVCPVGYVKIVTSAAGTFVPATTLLDAAQVTATYVNLSCAPSAALA
jgi:hypothetical protein